MAQRPYEDWNKDQLREHAREAGLKRYSRLNKHDLIQLIRTSESPKYDQYTIARLKELGGEVFAKELDSEIESALASLSPKLRAAIVLTSVQGLDVKEAARIEGCTTATLYWRIHQARRQLRSRLERWLSP